MAMQYFRIFDYHTLPGRLIYNNNYDANTEGLKNNSLKLVSLLLLFSIHHSVVTQMSFPLTVMSLLTTASWATYGTLIHDIYVQVSVLCL